MAILKLKICQLFHNDTLSSCPASTIWQSHHGVESASCGGSARSSTAGLRAAACLTPRPITRLKTGKTLRTLFQPTSLLKELTRPEDGKNLMIQLSFCVIKNVCGKKEYCQKERVLQSSSCLCPLFCVAWRRFYTLLVLSTALFGKPPFKNVIVNGLVLARWTNWCHNIMLLFSICRCTLFIFKADFFLYFFMSRYFAQVTTNNVGQFFLFILNWMNCTKLILILTVVFMHY